MNGQSGAGRRGPRPLFRWPPLVTAVALLSAAAAHADITLTVQPTRNQVYLGETFVLNLSVDGADSGLGTPDLSALGADSRLLGSQSSSYVSIVNGHVTRQQGRQFAFEIRPRVAGVLHTGPITLAYGGRTYTQNGPDVSVTGIESQQTVLAAVLASGTSVLVDEPFTITASIAVAALPPPNDAYEPLVPSDPPHLECDFLSQAEIPGLRTPDLQKLLQGLIQRDRRAPAFTINSYTIQPDLMADPFSAFGDSDPFRPRPARFGLSRDLVARDGRRYHEYRLSMEYTPAQEGDYTFGPLTFKGPVFIGANAQGQPLVRQVFAVGPAVTVRVVPPPEAGRPDWFIGSVGRNVRAHAELDASVCKTGDPLLLTLDVTGDLSLANMRPPLLNLQPALTNDFRIYDDNVEARALPSGKRFRYRVRPLRAGTLEFPPIQVAWFDTPTRAYRTTHTEAIPVQSRPNTQIISGTAEGATNTPSGIMKLTLRQDSGMPAAITLAPQGARPGRLLPSAGTCLAMLVGGPLLAAFAWSGRLWRRHRERLVAARRRQQAWPRARTALRRLARQPPDAAATGRTLREYLALRLGIEGQSVTGDEAVALLRQARAPAECAAAFGDLLTRLDQALYQPNVQGDVASAVRDAALELLPRLTAALDRPAAPAGEEEGL